MHAYLFRAAAMAAAVSLAGCAALPRERGYRETTELLQARLGTAPDWAADASRPAEIPTTEIGPADAVRLALQHHPRVWQAYARLGIGRAELEDARRVGNPRFGFSRLTSGTGGDTQITRELSLGLGDVLLLPTRMRLAAGELERLQSEVAADLVDFAAEVEAAWYASVGAGQVARMRDVVAHAAEQSAALAQRFFDAGNINRLQLEQERAAASQARIEAVRAAVDARRARSSLAGLLGLPADANWDTLTKLPAPLAVAYSADQLVERALQQRVDLAAAEQAVALREDALGVARRWRWLGAVDIGHDRKSEGSEQLRGPSLSLELPIFNQGQGAIARAQAELIAARAELDALALSVRNDARLGIEQLSLAHDIIERYRNALLPQREAVVARSQEQVNYMLIGVFELILAKQQEYDAYQEYLEAVRDYWVARSELRRIVGGALPDDATIPAPSIGVEAVLPGEKAPAMERHNPNGMQAEPTPAADPHAGHAMPSARQDAADPTDTPQTEATEATEQREDDAHDHHHHGGRP